MCILCVLRQGRDYRRIRGDECIWPGNVFAPEHLPHTDLDCRLLWGSPESISPLSCAPAQKCCFGRMAEASPYAQGTLANRNCNLPVNHDTRSYSGRGMVPPHYPP